jgi:Skp family chaperone for outer membrane proteins
MLPLSGDAKASYFLERKMILNARKNFGTLLLATAITLSGASVPSFAQKSATASTYKIGYFNLALVKASYPEAAESENLRAQADAQLKREVDESNRRLDKARTDKKSADEIKKLSEQLQIEINAKQKALAELVQSTNNSATEKILATVNAVAKDRGLDIIVDGAGVFAGGVKILENGVDVTDDIVRRLSPAQTNLRTQAQPAPQSAPKPAAAK